LSVFDPAVSAVAVADRDGDLPPGQPDQLGVQGGLVGFDDQQVVPASLVEVVGMSALGAARRR
jgi:hypothetical protein